ncbi:MAG: toprim domain-containing protein [Candidatus Bathycorpusculaceae bacterium]
MSTRLKEKEEKILRILESLAKESAKGIIIIVEGKKDIEALRAMGIEGKIMCVKTGGKSFLDVISEVEQTGAREVILLLDFDRRGKQGTKRVKRDLERAKIKPNMKFWCELSCILGKEVKDIEGLTTYMETLRKKAGNPL